VSTHPQEWPRVHTSSPQLLLTACSSSRLSLESSALCVDGSTLTPRPSVTPVSLSPSVGDT
jgi:hypothetical protein